MILNKSKIDELHSRLKLRSVPNWKTIPGLEQQINTLKSLLSDVFVRKRNEAVLLLGPGGCCKHLLIDYCLHSLCTEHEKDEHNVFLPGEYIRINIDGDYVDNDDDAFRIIARHLTSPSMRKKRFKVAQFKNMEFLEIVLQEAQICEVPLLFVLDHFSTFCSQSKQTLLYTLLDMCSNKNVQICIIGVDRDCCISELLEKRIQSRFSQRQILINYPTTMDSVQYVSSTLFLPGSDRETKMWNSAVKKIVLHEDFTKLIEEQSLICPFSYHILFVYFNRVILLLLSRLPESIKAFSIDCWRECFDIITKQNTIDRNCTLSYLGVNDLALLIAAKHFVKRQISNFCFLDLLESYNKWTTSENNFQLSIMSESLAWQSFQLLLRFNLLKYVSSNTSLVVGNNARNENTKKTTSNTVFRNGNEKNAPVILLLSPDEIDRIIKEGLISCPTVLENWALRWTE